MKPVTIYTTPTCHYCHTAKEFFNEHKVVFTENDVVEQPEKRQEMIDMTGQMGVPVIVVGEGDEKEIIIGFDEKKLKELLGISG
jgi:glutaredoxin 3